MTESQRQEYVLEYSKYEAYKVHSKLPKQLRGVVGIEDIQQNICLHYLEHKNSYDENKPFKPWIRKVIKSRGIDEVIGVWDQFSKDVSTFDDSVETAAEIDDEGVVEIVVVDLITPEMLCIAYYEELEMSEKVVVLVKEIKSMCSKFDISFDESNYINSFVNVLSYTLNDMGDEEFNKLSYTLRSKLAKYGEAMNENNIQITSTGKMRNLGIVKEIRSVVQSGVCEFKEVKKLLVDKGIHYTDSSIRTILWNEKKRAGVEISRSRSGIKSFVVDKFDYGRGVVTVAEMLQLLKEKNVRHSHSTVRNYIQHLRFKYGLTKGREL